MSDRIVGEISKITCESIRVSLRKKGCSVGCDLCVATTTGRGPMREAPNGIQMPLVSLGDVIRALQEAQRLAGRSARARPDQFEAQASSS